jgi:hypothetical protein
MHCLHEFREHHDEFCHSRVLPHVFECRLDGFDHTLTEVFVESLVCHEQRKRLVRAFVWCAAECILSRPVNIPTLFNPFPHALRHIPTHSRHLRFILRTISSVSPFCFPDPRSRVFGLVLVIISVLCPSPFSFLWFVIYLPIPRSIRHLHDFTL